MNHLLDIALTIIHVAIILFNLSGWAFHTTRKIHLVVICLTLISWFVIGIWKGLGYCFLTDWHWNIKYKLGETNLPASFITYMVNTMTGLQPEPGLVDTATLLIFLCAVGVTYYFNFIRK